MFKFINAVSNTVIDTINDVYHSNSLIFSGTWKNQGLVMINDIYHDIYHVKYNTPFSKVI